MTPDELVERLHQVIETATSDSITIDDVIAGEAGRAVGEHDRREAEAVRDEVTAALLRLAAVIDHAERIAGSNRAESTYVPERVRHADALATLAIARGDTNKRGRP